MNKKMKKVTAFLSMLILLSSNIAYASQVNQLVVTQVQTQVPNTTAIDMQDNSFKAFKELDKDINLTNTYLINHVSDTAATTELEFYMAKYLNQKAGLSYIGMNIGYAQGMKLNRYLKNGDETLLHEIMEDMYPAYRTEEYAQFFRNVYKYNQGVNNKLQILGFGTDRKENTVEALEKLLIPYIKNKEIKEDLELIKDVPAKEVFSNFRHKIDFPNSIYGEVLQMNEWWDLLNLLDSILYDKIKYNLPKLDLYRTRTNTTDKKILFLGRSLETDKDILTFTMKYKESERIDCTTLETQGIQQDIQMMTTLENNKYTLFKIQDKPLNYTIGVAQSKASKPYRFDQKDAENYIQQNLKPIDVTDQSFKDLQALDKSLKDTQIFLTGEEHANSQNYVLQMYLTKYFHQKAGAHIVLIELDFMLGEMINDYVQSGDSKQLEAIMKNLKGTLVYSKDFAQFLTNLKDYNASLAKNNKLRVYGIDMIYDSASASYMFNKILAKIPQQDPIHQITREVGGSYRDYGTKVGKRIVDNEKTYLKYLTKEEIATIDVALASLEQERTTFMEDALMREKIIINMFKKLVLHYPQEKIFGQMGIYHASQEYAQNEGYGYSTAEYLQKYMQSTKNKLITISYNYVDSYRMDLFGGKKESMLAYPDILRKYANAPLSLLDMTGKDNPLAYMYLDFQDNYVTDTFQYQIIIKGGRATEYYRQQ